MVLVGLVNDVHNAQQNPLVTHLALTLHFSVHCSIFDVTHTAPSQMNSYNCSWFTVKVRNALVLRKTKKATFYTYRLGSMYSFE